MFHIDENYIITNKKYGKDDFILVKGGKTADLYVSPEDYWGVKRAAPQKI